MKEANKGRGKRGEGRRECSECKGLELKSFLRNKRDGVREAVTNRDAPISKKVDNKGS